MPRVAINGGIFSRDTSVPEMRPTKAPVKTQTKTARGSGKPKFTAVIPPTTDANVMVVPIERSIPPVTMINVTPIAKTPFTQVDSKMETRLLGVKKYGLATEKKIISKMSVPNAKNFCAPAE